MPAAATATRPDPPVVGNTPDLRFCRECGIRGGPWRSKNAQRCVKCDEAANVTRKAWTKGYHAARARAVSRLVKVHKAEFERILDEERAKTDPTYGR